MRPIPAPNQPQHTGGGNSKPHPGSLGCYASHQSAYSRRQNHSPRPAKVDSKRIAAASVANASAFLQTALSKVTRRSAAHSTRASECRVTPDKVLTLLSGLSRIAEAKGAASTNGKPASRKARRIRSGCSRQDAAGQSDSTILWTFLTSRPDRVWIPPVGQRISTRSTRLAPPSPK